MVSKIRLGIEIILFTGALALLINLLFFQNLNEKNSNSALTAKIISNILKKENYSRNNNFHWDHMPLTYSFSRLENNCSEKQIFRVKYAFDIIKNLTKEKIIFKEILSFENSDIKIYCKGIDLGFDEKIREGETKYNVRNSRIRNAEINLFENLNCGDWPDVEIHETLHLFGYEHLNNTESIMNPYSEKCDLKKIDEWIIKDLIESYG